MANWTYPATDLDRAGNLLSVLGSFWNDMYAGRDQVRTYSTARAQVAQQTMLDLMETIASMSRYTVPIFHRDNWYALTLLESERNDSQTSLVRYDGSRAFNDGLVYDVPPERADHVWPMPESLITARTIMNRITSPTVLWSEGDHYLVDLERRALVFRENPFDNKRIPKKPVYTDGQITDREITLWIFRGEFDWDTIYRQFGYVLGLRLKSSTGYRDVMNAVYDAIVGGTSSREMHLALAAVTGCPLVLEQEETVEQVALDNYHRLIITDQHVYKFDPAVTALVEAGDTVYAGDSLTDALQIDELNRGEIPADLSLLAMGPGMLASCFYGDLLFEDKDVPLEVDVTDPSGLTRISFGLGGFPLDVDQFFDDIHVRGTEAAYIVDDPDCVDFPLVYYPADDCDTDDVYRRRATMAHLLDQRTIAVGEPIAEMLPATINPLQFLITNILRNNAFVVRIKAAQCTDGLGLHNLRLIRRIVPPHTAMFLVLELTLTQDSVTVDLIDDDTLATFKGMEPLTDAVPSSQVAEGTIGVRLVSGTCQ